MILLLPFIWFVNVQRFCVHRFFLYCLFQDLMHASSDWPTFKRRSIHKLISFINFRSFYGLSTNGCSKGCPLQTVTTKNTHRKAMYILKAPIGSSQSLKVFWNKYNNVLRQIDNQILMLVPMLIITKNDWDLGNRLKIQFFMQENYRVIWSFN